MKQIFISATGGKAGQSLVAWCIADILRSQGLRIGFFKPFVTRPLVKNGRVEDKDVLLMREYFDLKEETEHLCPVIPDDVPGDEVVREEQLMKIEECYERVKQEKDVLIIMGSEKVFYEPDSPYLPDGSLVNTFDAPVLLVDKFQSESMTMYSVLAIDSFLKERVKAVIVNQIPPEGMDACQNKLVPFFQKRGAPNIFLVPQDRILASVTVRNIIDIIRGQVLVGENRLENLVEGTSISSSHLKGSLHLFRRIYNKIILLGLTAENVNAPLDSSQITGIVLTGGRKPPPLIVNTCGDLGIPLVVTPLDTFDSMEKIQKQQIHITPQDSYKLNRFLQLLGGEEARQRIVNQILQ